jgi:oligopeptidase B
MQASMDRRSILMAGVGMSVVAGMPAFAQGAGPRRGAPQGPMARKVPKSTTQHGMTRVDDYDWIRDPNWQAVIDDPSKINATIKTHIEAENAYTKSVLLDPTSTLRTALFEELKGKIKQDDSSVPAKNGAFAYATRFRQGGQYPIVYRKAVDATTGEPSGAEQILIDGDKESKGEKFWRLQDWEIILTKISSPILLIMKAATKSPCVFALRPMALICLIRLRALRRASCGPRMVGRAFTRC